MKLMIDEIFKDIDLDVHRISRQIAGNITGSLESKVVEEFLEEVCTRDLAPGDNLLATIMIVIDGKDVIVHPVCNMNNDQSIG